MGGMRMNNTAKAGLSMFLMCGSALMMKENKYMGSLGDYFLKFIGLKAWSKGDMGFHLTVIYFGILFVIGLLLVDKYVVEGLKIEKIKVFLTFIVLMTVLSSITQKGITTIKKYSPGLLAIGFNSEESSMKYKYKDKKFVEFTAEIELTNYSNEQKTFNLCIDHSFYNEGEVEQLRFQTFDGKEAVFELGGHETQTFMLSPEHYNIVGGIGGESGIGGGIKKITLTDIKGNQVTLSRKDYLGSKQSK
jgi:hypothetical protein